MTLKLYAITDRHLVPDPIEAILALCEAHGPDLSVQIREKDLEARALCEWLARLVGRTRGARLLVNDRIDVALAFDGVGVHLPERGIGVSDARGLLGPDRPLGASAHDAAAARRKREEGADLVTLSPIFESPGKGAPIGLEPLREAAPAGGIYALGGIDRARDAGVIAATGVEGLAGIRTFWVS